MRTKINNAWGKLTHITAVMTAAAVLGLAAPPAHADLQSFQFTNFVQLVPGNVGTITSYPTNSVSTNYWSVGTNSWSTNLFLLNVSTGGKIDVRNYNTVGFDFNAIYTASNTAAIGFAVIKASGTAGTASPIVIINTNTSTIWYNDWETSPSAVDWIVIPLPAGTNTPINWRTNYDVSGCDFVGIYQETNSIATNSIGWVSNIIVSVNKKILPYKFP